MIDLYYWPTPNGHKITILLEEAELEYKIVPVNISAGDQFKPAFLKIAPNNRMPAIVDKKPLISNEPISIFESGAILLYLANKHNIFCGKNELEKVKVLEWLFWQMGGLGPMAGQNHHFNQYAPESIDYAKERYTNETGRLYAVLNKQLEKKDFITGSFSIADMACYPWVRLHKRQKQNISDFPNLCRWLDKVSSRKSVIKSYEIGKEISSNPVVDEKSKKILFGQSSKTIG